MIKVTYSSDISSTVGVGGEIVKSASELGKQASTIFKCEYDALKPPKGMTGIHLVALGDSEAYPMNRNGDLFSKEACQKYYDTFVKHGHVFEHHRNKDPKKAIGQIKAAAYNPDMHRIELYIWADNEKAHDHLERLEKTGEVPFSMACFRAGTPIATGDGLVPIENVKTGDLVLTHKGNLRHVTGTMSRDVAEYCEVSFVSWGNRILELTGTHPVLAATFDDISRKYRKDHSDHPNKRWKRQHRDLLHTVAKWKKAEDLTPYDYMCVPIQKPAGKASADSVKWARLCGYYIAEGSFSGKKGNLSTLFTCNINDCFVEELGTLANWTSVTHKSSKNSDKAVRVCCHDKSTTDMLLSACGRRCENKRIPKEIKNGTYEDKLNFAAAWFNGDGWQDKSGLHWSIKYSGLALELQMLLASVGIATSCTKINHKFDRGIVKSPNAYEHVVTVSNEFSDRFEGISKAKEAKIYGMSKLRTFISGNYMMVPIAGVKKIKKSSRVYNFSVEGDESYTAQGLAVHNCRVPFDRCSCCGAIRERPGDKSECDHIKYQLGKIAEDGTQIGTYNDEPTWFDISFVGRPADRIAWNLKTASAMPEDLTINSSVKQAEIEGYVLPDDLAMESEPAKRKYEIMQKLASAYEKCAAWLSGEAKPTTGRDKYTFELRKLAGARLDDASLNGLRELDPSDAFAALGDAGVVMDAPSFFKYAFGPDYGIVEKYIPSIEKKASAVVRKAVDDAACAEFCSCGLYDARDRSILSRPCGGYLMDALCKSAAARGFGTEDAVTSVLEAMASCSEPSFSGFSTEKTAEDVDQGVVERLARKYVMYKLAGICAAMSGKVGASLNEDDVVFVSAAQDLRTI